MQTNDSAVQSIKLHPVWQLQMSRIAKELRALMTPLIADLAKTLSALGYTSSAALCNNNLGQAVTLSVFREDALVFKFEFMLMDASQLLGRLGARIEVNLLDPRGYVVAFVTPAYPDDAANLNYTGKTVWAGAGAGVDVPHLVATACAHFGLTSQSA